MDNGLLVRAVALGLCLCLFAEISSAQYLNRALYQGRGEEEVRRNYNQDFEYYLDRFSFVDMPPWWNERLEPFRNRFFAGGGSVSSADLTLEGQLNLTLPIGKGVSVGFYYLESENQANQYQRVAPALDYQFSPAMSVFALLEGTVEKEDDDLSFGMNLFHTQRGRTRIMFTFADFSDGKSQDFEYTKKPYGLMVSGDYRWDGGSEVYYETSAQLPFEQRFTNDDALFKMWRVIALGEGRYALNGRDKLVLAVYTEFTKKSLEPDDTSSPLNEDFDGDMQRLRFEWWRKISNDSQWSTGLSALRLRNDGARSNDPSQNLEEDRDELLFIARMRIALTGFILFEPNIWAGYVDYQNQLGGVTVNKDFDGFQGKLGLPLILRFSRDALLSLHPTVQLDQLTFGGGSIQFQALF